MKASVMDRTVNSSIMCSMISLLILYCCPGSVFMFLRVRNGDLMGQLLLWNVCCTFGIGYIYIHTPIPLIPQLFRKLTLNIPVSCPFLSLRFL